MREYFELRGRFPLIERNDANGSFSALPAARRIGTMTKRRKDFTRLVPGAVVILVVLFQAALPARAADCGMSRGATAGSSLAAPDCCTDGSCPKMTLDAPKPDILLTASSLFVPPAPVPATPTVASLPVATATGVPPVPSTPPPLRPPLRI
jgi:hypothetical protein